MLLPSILVRRLDFKGASCQKYGVVQILKVEQDSRQVEKDLSIVWGNSEGPTEIFNRRSIESMSTSDPFFDFFLKRFATSGSGM